MRAASFARSTFVVSFLALALAACGGGGGGAFGNSGVQPAAPSQNGGTSASGPSQITTSIAKSYTLTDLGPPAGNPWLVPRAVNNSGTVVIESSSSPLGSLPCPICSAPPQGYVYENGSLHALPPLPGNTETFADDINNDGTIVGGSTSPLPTVPETAVMWRRDLSIVNLGLGIAAPGSNAEASAISDAGKIAGSSFNATVTLPTIFDGMGGASDPCGPGIQGYFRSGITDSGVAAGDELLPAGGAAVMTCPPFTAVETPSNPAWLNFGFDMNNAGTVVGRLSPGPSKAIFHPFMYQHGVTTDLGSLFPGDSAAVGAAFAINDGGMIVGFSSQSGAVIGPPSSPPVNPRAFVYANGKMVDLNTLLPAGCANWTLITAEDISNNGYIVGVAFVGGYPNGSEHAYLLTPHS